MKYPDISAKPHQQVRFAFPKGDYGKQVVVRRCCQLAWFERWPWLHYREDDDCVFCHTCVKAFKELKIPTRNIDCEYLTNFDVNSHLCTICVLFMLNLKGYFCHQNLPEAISEDSILKKIFWGSMPPDPPIESTHYVCATTPSLTYWPDHLKVASSVPEAALLQQFLARKNDHYRPLYLWQSHKYT